MEIIEVEMTGNNSDDARVYSILSTNNIYETIFYYIFSISMVVTGVNLENIGIDANQIEKSLLFLSCIFLLIISRVSMIRVCIAVSIIILTIISAIFTEYGGFLWKYYFGGALSLCVPLMFMILSPPERVKIFIFKAIFMLPFLFLVFGAMWSIADIKPIMRPDFLGSYRLTGSTIAAYFSASVAGSVVSLMFLLQRRAVNQAKFFLLPILIALGALSGGRMAFVVMMANLIVHLYTGTSQSLSKKIGWTIIILCGGAIVYLFFGEPIVTRFASGSESGRELIRERLIEIANHYPDWGVGLGHEHVVFPYDLQKRVETNAVHNEYIRFILDLGYPIGVSVVVLISILVLSYGRRSNNVTGYIVMCATMGAFCLTDNVFSVPAIFFIFVVCIYGYSPQTSLCKGLEQRKTARSGPHRPVHRLSLYQKGQNTTRLA